MIKSITLQFIMYPDTYFWVIKLYNYRNKKSTKYKNVITKVIFRSVHKNRKSCPTF